jgi:diguanylate cyclase (GGDEF)-like protein
VDEQSYEVLGRMFILISEVVLFSYLIIFYRKHTRIGNWMPVFIGAGLLVAETFMRLMEDMKWLSFTNTINPSILNQLGFILLILGLLRIVSRLIRISHMDFLTQAYTKRYIDKVLDKALNLSKRKNNVFSIAFIDLDDFKLINDRYGHEEGDFLLSTIAKIIQDNVRQGDCVGRYGGDEFMLILIDVGQEEAEELVERCREAVLSNQDLQQYQMRLSGGVATYPIDAVNSRNLARIADMRMYEDKERNKESKLSFVKNIERMDSLFVDSL